MGTFWWSRGCFLQWSFRWFYSILISPFHIAKSFATCRSSGSSWSFWTKYTTKMKLGVWGVEYSPPPRDPRRAGGMRFTFILIPFYLELPVFGLRLLGGRSSFFFPGGGVVHGKVLKFQSNRCSNFEENGRSRAPIVHFLAPLLASRDPVGIQSGSSRAPMSGGSQTH